jgi:hypothetical protein
LVPAEQVDDTIFTLDTWNSLPMLLELEAEDGEDEEGDDADEDESPPAAHLPLTSTVWPTCVDRSTLGDAISLIVPLSLEDEDDELADGDELDGELALLALLSLELPAPFFTLVSSKLPAVVPACTQPVSFVPPRSDVDDAWPLGYGEDGEDGGCDGVDGG